MTKPTLFILAAGIGNKYGGMKNMEEIGPNGEIFLDYLVYDAIRAGFSKLVFVLFSAIEQEFKTLILPRYASKIAVECIFQDKDSHIDTENKIKTPYPWSSIRSLHAGRMVLREPFGVVNAEDFYGSRSFELLHDAVLHIGKGDYKYANVAFQLQNTIPEYSSATRGICRTDTNNMLLAVDDYNDVEWFGGNLIYKDSEKRREEVDALTLTSMNMWAFSPEIFNHTDTFVHILYTERGINAHAPYTITQMMNELLKEGKVAVKLLETPDKWLGISSKEDRTASVLRINEYIKNGLYPKRIDSFI